MKSWPVNSILKCIHCRWSIKMKTMDKERLETLGAFRLEQKNISIIQRFC